MSKRSLESDSGGFKVPSLPRGVKAAHRATESDMATDNNNNNNEEQESSGEDDNVTVLAAGQVKRQLAALERAFLVNAEQRVEFSTEPSRFLESEIALDDAVKQLELLATQPQLYSLLVAANTAESLTALLAHDNSDVANDVVHVLVELTDPAVVLEAEAETRPFVAALLQHDLLPMLVSHLSRLLEIADVALDAELSAMYDAFGIVENLVELEPELVCRRLVERGQFVPLLLKQLSAGGSVVAVAAAAAAAKSSGAERTRLYAAELLSIVLQQAPLDALASCVTRETVEALLTALALFRREPKHYSGAEEPELAANLFNALCSLLLRGGAAARRLLHAAEGLELLLILARSIPADKAAGDKFKRSDDVRLAAVRALEYAIMGSRDACVRFVDLQGLGTLAKYVVGSDGTKPKQRHALTLRATMTLAALLRQLAQIDDNEDVAAAAADDKAQKAQERDNALERVLTKLLEPDKLGAVVALHASLHAAVSLADRDVALAMRVKELNGEPITAENEEEWYSTRLDAGLFELQQTDLVLALVATRFKPVVVAALRGAQIDPTLVAEIVSQYAQQAADDLRAEAGVADADDDTDDAAAARALEDRLVQIAAVLVDDEEEQEERA